MYVSHKEYISLLYSLSADIDHKCSGVLLSAVKAGSTFFFRPKLVHAWCFETILITNCYIFGSNEGIICVLCTLKINHKHFVSMETAPPIVNKAVNNALRL